MTKSPLANGKSLLPQVESLLRRLDRLAVALMPASRPFADWFDGIACRTLGDLRRLPRPACSDVADGRCSTSSTSPMA